MLAIKVLCMLSYTIDKDRNSSVFGVSLYSIGESHPGSRIELLDLPIDLLILLPQFLHSIEDFTNASLSCQALRGPFLQASPSTVLRLAVAPSRAFF